MSNEYSVYLNLTKILLAKNWKIICASPPSGTDNRFRKCLLPRREIGDERGLRDEVDLTAHDNDYLILVECKPKLSDSLFLVNTLNESDYDKLHRILNSFSPQLLVQLLKQASGLNIPPITNIEIVLAVGLVDCSIPNEINVIEIQSESSVRIWGESILSQKLL